MIPNDLWMTQTVGFCFRMVSIFIFYRSSPVRKTIIYFPGVREMLSQASRCAVCSEAFLNTWLECVKFVKAHGVSCFTLIIVFKHLLFRKIIQWYFFNGSGRN